MRPSALEAFVGVPVAFVAGVLVGTLGSFKHQAGISAATGSGFPYGLLLSLAMVAAVVAALRVAFDSRVYALAAGIGVVAAILILTRKGPGGSVVVIGNVPGLVWMIAPAVLVLVLVALPGRRPRTGRSGADGILEADAEEEDPAP